MILKLESVNVEQSAVQSLEETKGEMLVLNQQQLEEGNLSTGNRIEWLKDNHYPYTKPYERYKKSLGLQTRVVDLNLSGDYYKSRRVTIQDGQIQYSSDIKTGEYLQNNYGENIQGLTDDNKATYTKETFFPDFKQKIEEATGLKFS